MGRKESNQTNCLQRISAAGKFHSLEQRKFSLKLPIMTAADDKFDHIFHDSRGGGGGLIIL